jgi:aerobic-type carbon monoxide dehydrogenase small subunit (CoxS/CutS family)
MTLLVSFRLNGRPLDAAVAPETTLLELLRYGLRLTGTKQGCDKGDCGACTVQLDGEPVLACLTLAAQVGGRDVRTVEGLGGARPHPLQEALDRNDAAQCGFCMPGILMSAERLLRPGREVTREEAAAAIGGNLCRCTGYVKILDAIVEASREAPR